MNEISKPLLVIDLVGTLEDNWRDKRAWFLAHGYEFPLWQPPRKNIVDVVGEEVYAEMKAAVATDETIPDDPPIPGSAEALRLLHPRYRIAVLSTRSFLLREATEKFLQRNFDGQYDDLHLMGDERGCTEERKIDWCLSHGAYAFIDDDDRHLHGMREQGIIPFLFNPYNRPIKPPEGSILVSSWTKIGDMLLWGDLASPPFSEQ